MRRRKKKTTLINHPPPIFPYSTPPFPNLAPSFAGRDDGDPSPMVYSRRPPGGQGPWRNGGGAGTAAPGGPVARYVSRVV